MSLSRDSKSERIAKFLLRHRFRGQQGIQRIMWEENELLPLINKLKAGEAIPDLGLEAGFAYEIEVVESNDNPNHEAPADDSGTPNYWPTQGPTTKPSDSGS